MRGLTPRNATGTGGKTPPAPPLSALRLAGIDDPVILPQDRDLITALQKCIHGWPCQLAPFSPDDAAHTPAALSVIEPRSQGRFRAHSRYMDDPLDDLPVATAICAVLADLSQAYCDTRADHVFGLHCGGVSIGSRGIILAGERRAGKSTLVARLSAEPGVAVLCDDVLPVATDGTMIGLGLAPRLRLPLPEAASSDFRAHVARWMGAADDRYGYLLTPALTPHGYRGRAEAFVLLDRRPDAATSIHSLPQDELLRSLVERSIAGPDGPERVFDAARALASGLVGLRLVYSDLDEAVAQLVAAFPADGRAVAHAVTVAPALPPRPPATETGNASPVSVSALCRRAAGTATRRMGGAAFLWRAEDAMLWHLNPTAQAVWALLSRPASPRTLARALHDVFPSVPFRRLQDDTCLLVGQLADKGLVCISHKTAPVEAVE